MPEQPTNSSDNPTRDQLAGVYVYIEAEEKLYFRPEDAPAGSSPAAEEEHRPTREELAGVYVEIHGEEKVTIFPIELPPQTPP